VSELFEGTFDAVVIGGGFYGSAIAIYLVKQCRLQKVLLVEREPALLTRASYNNQARIHNGYHYPRSFTTAYRSRTNFPRFLNDWPSAVRRDYTTLYGIARRNSKVTARQFECFCHNVGMNLEPADTTIRQLFEPRLIENVFLVEELVFDTTQLALWAQEEIKQHGIHLQVNTRVDAIHAHEGGLQVSSHSGHKKYLTRTRYVFNCTYSGLNQFQGDFTRTRTQLKHEIAEMALIQAPRALSRLGVTIMDGPFFSMMPFPTRNLHTLSHVRYTPHMFWSDEQGVDPYAKLAKYDQDTRSDRMLRDACRYIPALRDAKYVESLLEVKTVLARSENDDGRPILFEEHPGLPGAYSVLGGKIDNIFDVLEKIHGKIFN